MNILTKEEALIHLFRVAAGLESQIIGDFEIIRQIKKAYSRFKKKERQNSNPYLERAINAAIQISKRIKMKPAFPMVQLLFLMRAVHYILNNQKRITEKIFFFFGSR